MYSYFEEKRKKEVFRMCQVGAQVLLYHGPALDNEEIYKVDPECPMRKTIWSEVGHSGLRWYIKEHMTLDDEYWNSDFLNGLCECGTLKMGSTHPEFWWRYNKKLPELIEGSFPYYYQNIGGNVKNGGKKLRLRCVPAFYVKYEKDTLSYIAGVLSTGLIKRYKKQNYFQYNIECMEAFERYGIPIEEKQKHRFFVSPIWPSLFTRFMPENFRSYFKKVSSPAMAKEYATVLFYTHINKKKFDKWGIPYMPSHRNVYYKFKNDKLPTLKYIERLRVEYELFNLCPQIKECIRLCYEDYKSENSSD